MYKWEKEKGKKRNDSRIALSRLTRRAESSADIYKLKNKK